MRSESMETCAEGSWVDSTLTSSSGDGGPCPGGCAAPYTSPTPSHTPPDACTHSIPFSYRTVWGVEPVATRQTSWLGSTGALQHRLD